ncbi:MAG TPA: AMP-binding protein [Verrucomicrobiae bacterium]|nr:AMP-binding protein [Verrucomicrobiae bacterium]
MKHGSFPNASGEVLVERWLHHAAARPDDEALVHWVAGEERFAWTWKELLRAAAGFVRTLRQHGVGRGDVCALIIRHHRDFYPLYIAVAALGALPAVLAYPNPRLHPDKFRQGLAGMAQRSGLDWVLTEQSLDDMVRPLSLAAHSTVKGILYPLEWRREAGTATLNDLRDASITPDDPCLLQHSSGTTGLQKPVMLTHRNVLEHLDRYGRAIALTSADKVVSWLPLYHDMGLIAAFHLSLGLGVPLVQMDPFEWVQAPALFIEALAREGGTISWLPNFAYNFMADRIRDLDPECHGMRLDQVRLLINCSEPVRADSHEKFASRLAAMGLKRGALATCYAMAETTFAVTQSTPGVEPVQVEADRNNLALGFYQPAASVPESRTCLSSGRLIPGCELKIVNAKGKELPDGAIGEMLIRSVSMFEGYRNNPEQTSTVLKDGWYHSGDYGFRLDGEHFVIGRKKDLIIVAGKNLYPEDIEDAIAAVPGVIAGRIVAFGIDNAATGTEEIGVVAETIEKDPAGIKALRLAIMQAAMRIDVTVTRVYLAPPRWLVKSSSGKPSRPVNRQRALTELQTNGGPSL